MAAIATILLIIKSAIKVPQSPIVMAGASEEVGVNTPMEWRMVKMMKC